MAKKKTKEKELKTEFADKGDKITEEKCPHCREELVLQNENGAEVFVCENCKFRVEKKEDSEDSCECGCDCCEK